jgi:ferredoxin/bacterioferritin-associated ferredoxin
MKTIAHQIEIIDANCTGCFYCERACPTSAITMIGPKKDALAVVDNALCIACSRCIDVCDDDAMLLVERDEPQSVGFEASEDESRAAVELCRTAGMEPKQSVCWCSGSVASEVSAAILAGNDTFEKLALATGVQSGCLMYCSVTIRRLLLAHSQEAASTSKVKRYECQQGILDIPPELAERYPNFGIIEEQAYVRERAEKLRQREQKERTEG